MVWLEGEGLGGCVYGLPCGRDVTMEARQATMMHARGHTPGPIVVNLWCLPRGWMSCVDAVDD